MLFSQLPYMFINFFHKIDFFAELIIKHFGFVRGNTGVMIRKQTSILILFTNTFKKAIKQGCLSKITGCKDAEINYSCNPYSFQM